MHQPLPDLMKAEAEAKGLKGAKKAKGAKGISPPLRATIYTYLNREVVSSANQ